MSYATESPIATKLPAMRVTFSESEFVPFPYRPQMREILLDEIRKNCTTGLSDSIAGRIDVELIDAKLDDSYSLALLFGLSLGTLNVLGLPMRAPKVTADVKIHIYDSNNNELKTYRYYSRVKSVTGLYYGKTVSAVSNDVGRDIADKFKKDLNNDACELNKRLLTKTYYPLGTENGQHIEKALVLCTDYNYKKALEELKKARQSNAISEQALKIYDEVYNIASSGRQEQVRENAQMWATIGSAVVSSTLSATTKTNSTPVTQTGTSNANVVSTTSSSGEGSSSISQTAKQDAINMMNRYKQQKEHAEGRVRWYRYEKKTKDNDDASQLRYWEQKVQEYQRCYDEWRVKAGL